SRSLSSEPSRKLPSSAGPLAGQRCASERELEALLGGLVARRELEAHRVRLLTDAHAEPHLHRSARAAELLELDQHAVAALFCLAAGQVDVLDVLAVALAVARALAFLV